MNPQAQPVRWQFWIDHGSTFIDIVARRPLCGACDHVVLRWLRAPLHVLKGLRFGVTPSMRWHDVRRSRRRLPTSWRFTNHGATLDNYVPPALTLPPDLRHRDGLPPARHGAGRQTSVQL